MYGCSYPLSDEKFLEFFSLVKNKDFFLLLQYKLLSRTDIHKFHFKVILEVDKNKVMIEKSNLDSNIFPQNVEDICFEKKWKRGKRKRWKPGSYSTLILNSSFTSFFLWKTSPPVSKWKLYAVNNGIWLSFQGEVGYPWAVFQCLFLWHFFCGSKITFFF